MSSAYVCTHETLTIPASITHEQRIIAALWLGLKEAGWEPIKTLPNQQGILMRQGSGSRYCVQWKIEDNFSSVSCTAWPGAVDFDDGIWPECGPRKITNPVFNKWLLVADDRSALLFGADDYYVRWFSFIGDFDEFYPRSCSFLNWWGNTDIVGYSTLGIAARSVDESETGIGSGISFINKVNLDYPDVAYYVVAGNVAWFYPGMVQRQPYGYNGFMYYRLPVWIGDTSQLTGLIPGLVVPWHSYNYMIELFGNNPFVEVNGTWFTRWILNKYNMEFYYQAIIIDPFRRIGL